MKNILPDVLSLVAGIAVAMVFWKLLAPMPSNLFGYANGTYPAFAIFFVVYALLGAGFGHMSNVASQSRMIVMGILLALPMCLLLWVILGLGGSKQVPLLLALIEPLAAAYIGIFLVHLWQEKQK